MADIVRKIASGSIRKFSGLPDNEAELLASTATPDRMGDVIDQGERAISYSAWMALGGTILRDHDNRQPVANTIRANAAPAGFTCRIKFPDWGVSGIADQTRREVKAGLLVGVSIGFSPISYELREPNKPYAGLRFKEIELLEISLTAIPANADAMVVGKGASALKAQRDRLIRAMAPTPYPISTEELVQRLLKVADLTDRCGDPAEAADLRRRAAVLIRLRP
jgi:HK97 family phage prohead protease